MKYNAFPQSNKTLCKSVIPWFFAASSSWCIDYSSLPRWRSSSSVNCFSDVSNWSKRSAVLCSRRHGGGVQSRDMLLLYWSVFVLFSNSFFWFFGLLFIFLLLFEIGLEQVMGLNMDMMNGSPFLVWYFFIIFCFLW